VCDPATRAVRRVNPTLKYYRTTDSDRASVYFATDVSKQDVFDSCITICRMSAVEGPCIGFALDKLEDGWMTCTPLYKKTGGSVELYPAVKDSRVYSIAEC
jgi:hypothetical protein